MKAPSGDAPVFDLPHLAAALVGLGAQPPSVDLFGRLRTAYTEPVRHYHTADHVAACLGFVRRHTHLLARPWEVEAALWFHDAVYDPRRADNEERSADWARRALTDLDSPPEAVDRVAAMVLATRSHQTEDPDTRLLLDADLSVLGAATGDFEAYDRGIRMEYSWVPEAEYRAGRSRVLASFLARPEIYGTPEIRAVLEARARQNLRRKIAELGGGAG